MRRATRRKEEIVQCFVVATGGRLPTDLEALLCAMRAQIPDITEAELRCAIQWALRRSRRLERGLTCGEVRFGDDALAC